MKRAQQYWENKILNWEKRRYSLGSLLFPTSWTVRRRLAQASTTILKNSKAGSSIVELGCGSGLLAKKISEVVGTYTGVDFSQRAIENAIQNFKEDKDRFNFVHCDVEDWKFIKADLTVFLGLTDWIPKEEILGILNSSMSKDIFFSYTDTAKLNPYRFYRFIVDQSIQSTDYGARTYSTVEIVEMLDSCGYTVEILDRPGLIDPGGLIWARKCQ